MATPTPGRGPIKELMTVFAIETTSITLHTDAGDGICSPKGHRLYLDIILADYVLSIPLWKIR